MAFCLADNLMGMEGYVKESWHGAQRRIFQKIRPEYDLRSHKNVLILKSINFQILELKS